MALQTVQVSVEPRRSTAMHKADTALKDRSVVSQSHRLCPSPLPRFQQRCLCTSRMDACERISAIQAVLKSRTVAIQKGNKHQLGQFFLLEACQRNGTGWSTVSSPANAKFPLPHRHSSITRTCCSSAQAPSFLSLHALGHSTGSERVDAFGLRVVEVIICMIIRDSAWYRLTSQASLSFSLYYSQESLTHNIGSASAPPIIRKQKKKHEMLTNIRLKVQLRSLLKTATPWFSPYLLSCSYFIWQPAHFWKGLFIRD